jgi:hypothetical protein
MCAHVDVNIPATCCHHMHAWVMTLCPGCQALTGFSDESPDTTCLGASSRHNIMLSQCRND